MQHMMFGDSIQMNWRKIQSLIKYNANTDVFPLGGHQNKVKDASAAKRQITEECNNVFLQEKRVAKRL